MDHTTLDKQETDFRKVRISSDDFKFLHAFQRLGPQRKKLIIGVLEDAIYVEKKIGRYTD